jgi:succinyl-diaminopimelate desuccinylase
MSNNILSLAKKFVAIKSIPQNPKELEKILEVALGNLKGYTIEKFEHQGAKSALIYNSPKRPKKFKIILNGHLDVIPGKEHQYIPQVKGNRLYGVGSMDMKSNVACLITAFKEVAEKVSYPLGLQLVTDEQIGGFNGTKHQVDKGVRADFVIAGEPTNFDIVNKAKGILWLKISAKGKSAHGAYPWKGENAIWKMNDFLNALKKKYPDPTQEKWVTTVNLSKISSSNETFNKIPDDCSVSLDIRYIPEESENILKNIQKLLPKDFKLEVITQEPALATNSSNEYLKLLQKAGKQIINKKIILRGAQGSSDARHFTRVDCPGIEFGPIGEGSGSDNEWVDIPSLEKYYQILKSFLLSL